MTNVELADTTEDMSDADDDTPLAPSVISRRMLGQGLVGVGLFAGCRPCFSPFTPRHQTKKTRGPRTFTVRAEVSPGRFRKLVDMLDDPSFNPFVVPGPGVHYARLFTTDHQYLYFMVIYDDYADAIRFLHLNAKGVDEVFSNTVGFPGTDNEEVLDQYVRSTLLCVELFYRAYNESQPELRNALVFRDDFLKFMRSIEGLAEPQLRERYAKFLANPNFVNHDRESDNDIDWSLTEAGKPVSLTPLARDGEQSAVNTPDRVSPFTLLARVQPDKVNKLSRTLRLGTFATIDLGLRPLKNLPTLHFARVSILEGDRMLFASVYDGDFIQYVEDFGTRIAKEIDTVFGAGIGYPLAGSQDIFAFKDWLRANQIVTRDFSGAYLDRSLLQIQSSLALSSSFARFCKRVGPEHRNLPRRLRCFLHDNQNLLT